jgi:hypothetical protein
MNYKQSVFFIFLLTLLNSCKAQVNIYDGFETKRLSKIWGGGKMVKGAFELQSELVRLGHGAAQITLNKGDVFEAGNDSSRATERDELIEAKKFWSDENKEYEYKFSLFLPDSFPIVPTRLVIAQWKQKCPYSDGFCSDDNPVLAIRYVSGRLYITLKTDSSKRTIFETTEEIRNRWLDFVFRVRFSSNNDGRLLGWLNEKQIVALTGTTCYSSKRGYPDISRFYFKTGLYRDVMAQPMTIYVDEYSKKEIIKNDYTRQWW